MTDPAGAEVIRRLHRAVVDSADLGELDAFFSDDFVSHNMPPGLPPGVDGVKRFLATFRDALSELDLEIDELVADGDRVAVATTTRGVHTGELMGVPGTGRAVSITGIDVVRIENGRIAEHRGLTDTVGLLRQISA